MGKNIKDDGLDEYMKLLAQYQDEEKALGDMKQIVYEGAKVAADALRSEISSQKTTDSPRTGITKEDKEDLMEGMGVSTMETKKGDVNVKVGFAGYSKKNYWKNPQTGKRELRPIPMLARVIMKGTSWHKRVDLVDRTVRKNKDKAVEAMSAKADEVFKTHFEK